MKARKTIKQLRPKLKTVAPLTFWICVGFALVNAIIFGILTQVETTVKDVGVPIVTQTLTFDVWGWWFLALSVLMTYGLIRNNWKVLKRALMLGLVSKLLWSYGLLFMIYKGNPVFVTFTLWAFLAWVQAWTIIFFTPTITDKRDTLPENERFKK